MIGIAVALCSFPLFHSYPALCEGERGHNCNRAQASLICHLTWKREFTKREITGGLEREHGVRGKGGKGVKGVVSEK